MKEMPGIMSRMLPLPVAINDDLASRLFSSTSQVRSYFVVVDQKSLVLLPKRTIVGMERRS